MKKLVVVAVLGILYAGAVASLGAEEIKNNIQANLNQTAIDALTQDLGAIIGGGAFHTGKALGFPIGFDVGVHAPFVHLQDDDAILKDDNSTWGTAFAQAEVGLPLRINLIVRGGQLGDGDVLGGGVRLGILKPSVPGLPSLSVSAIYNKFDHDMIDFTNLSANAALSFDFPIIHPYVGAGYDFNSLKVKDLAYVGAPGTATANLDSDKGGYRVEGGINLSIIPFTYITLGVGMANGEEMYHGGLGVNF